MNRLAASDWLVPDWPAPATVRALCTTRSGGMSAPPYDSLNLGTHVGDDAVHVQHNRARFQQVLGARAVFLNQVHGTRTLELGATTVDGQEADGCWTQQRALACTVMVADCLPILLCDRQGTRVAAVHAGWRGLAGEGGNGVVEEIYPRFMAAAPVGTAQAAPEIIAWLGPCIGPQAFEVGPEVRAAFVAHSPAAAQAFAPRPGDKWLADLAWLARQRLQTLGITGIYGNDGSPGWCTVSNPSRFFSHRRDRVSGRFAASIWLV